LGDLNLALYHSALCKKLRFTRHCRLKIHITVTHIIFKIRGGLVPRVTGDVGMGISGP
jgi:hypothetical protein